MIDFWLTLGTMVIEPKVYNLIADTKPVFTKGAATLTNAGQETKLPAAGTLDEASTVKMRAFLHRLLNARFPNDQTIVSLYTAAKICQLVVLDGTMLSGVVNKAHTAWDTAAKAHNLTTPSRNLVAIAGLCLIDDGLTLALETAESRDYARTFFLDPSSSSPEWGTLLSWVASSERRSWQDSLMGASSWDPGCDQRITFYDRMAFFIG